ncbi:VCAN [Branchiostoma lanceolatum]|uniref:VCAN protein n=1 Tax=Branchiostoma lanceolatum TaxID=7740 RepID=A0A8J9YS17_BRALA|nr:VCAN [Branchiostoma lanceolatum]
MAATSSSEQEDTKGVHVGVKKLSSGPQQEVHADDEKELEEGMDVPKMSSKRQPSVPNEYTPVPTRGQNTREVKEGASRPIAKIRSKAANRGKHAYDHTIVGKQTGASPYGSAPEPGPRYLHVGDHVVMCSGYEPEDDYGYREPKEVNKGYEEDHCSHDYDNPEEVHVSREPESVSNAFEEESCSHDYDRPEDVYGYKDHKEVNFVYRAKERVVEKWSEFKSSKVFWLVLGSGLLVVASVVIMVFATVSAAHITPGGRVAFDSKLQQNGTMILESSTPWKTTFYKENNSAFDEFIVIDSTPTYLPFTNNTVTADTLPMTVTILSTMGLNECIKNPCQHGHCVNKDGGYKCTCSPGWTGLNCQQALSTYRSKGDTKYKVVLEKKTYNAAKQTCAAAGGRLAVIKTEAVYNFLLRLIRDADGADGKDYWFGLTGVAVGPGFGPRTVGRSWTWSDGTPLSDCSFTKWAPGEPNYLFPHGQNCAHLWSGADHQWDDTSYPRLDGKYLFRQNPIEKCYQVALSRGLTVFAVQNGGWCGGSADGLNTYNKYGPSTACKADGEGGEMANEVYKITGQDAYTKMPRKHGRNVNKDDGYLHGCSPGWTGQNCQQALRCQRGWSKYNNHCYKQMTDKVSWSSANSRCKQHGAMLTSINDGGENNFIAGLVSNGG